MHRARTFFYVAAGLFLLAGAYHLGARNATANVATVAECAGTSYPDGGAVVVGNTMYIGGNGVGPFVSPPIPGRAVACSPFVVLLENGDVYKWTGNSNTPWQLDGNVGVSGIVPTQLETFGSLKARYRGEPAQPGR